MCTKLEQHIPRKSSKQNCNKDTLEQEYRLPRNQTNQKRASTWGGHEDELVGLRDGVVMDLDGDAATSPRYPSKIVKLAAEVWDQNPRVLHCLALQVGLWCRAHLHPVHWHCWHCRHWILDRETERTSDFQNTEEEQSVLVYLAYIAGCVQFVRERQKWITDWKMWVSIGWMKGESSTSFNS